MPVMLPTFGESAKAGPPIMASGGGHGEHSGDTGLDLHVWLLSGDLDPGI